jgi:hypothetical protein
VLDPLLPCAAEAPDKDLAKEFVAAGVAQTAADSIVASLAKKMASAAVACAHLRATLATGLVPPARLPMRGALRILLPDAAPTDSGSSGPPSATRQLYAPPADPIKALLVYEPDADAVRTWLAPVRQAAAIPVGGAQPGLYGQLSMPLYAARSKKAVAARLEAAGISITPFTAVLELNMSHYAKLAMLHRLAEAGLEDPSLLPEGDPFHKAAALAAGAVVAGGAAPRVRLPHPSPAFLHQLFCLLARYETFSGNTGGIQGAVPHYVFDALDGELAVRSECFASPLNCHFPSFCSAFPDTDAPFGSRGSFFEFAPLSGCFEANPPFVNATMLAMAKRLSTLLTAAEEAGGALLFFVIVPSWTDAYFFSLLADSRFLRARQSLVKKQHEYIDGLQHRAERTTWGANVDSTFFVLATAAAAAAGGLLVGSVGARTDALMAAFARTADDDAHGRVFKYELPLAPARDVA